MRRELTISNKNHKFLVRFSRYFIYLLPFVVLFVVIGIWQKEFNWYVLPAIVLVACVAYCLYFTMTVLHKISFNYETGQVEVEILEFDRIKKRYSIPFEDFRAVARQRFRTKTIVTVLEIFANNKLIYTQPQTFGWTSQDLYNIQHATKEITAAI
jgi:hypothetical protein